MTAPDNVFAAVLWVLGGLALFLYGIELMGQALRRAAGTALRNGLAVLTRTTWRGLATGTVLTALVQSSSATTVMVVGFINAGLLSFSRSMGLILGANVGTTVTPLITALDLDEYALPLLGLGFLAAFAARKRVWRESGVAVMGFGMLFFGLMLMKFAVSGYGPEIRSWLSPAAGAGAGAPMAAFLVSTAATAVIQSSSAAVVMIQAMAFQEAIPGLDTAIPLILGAHVGTCVTALLAGLRTSLAARKAAVAHLAFNLAGTLVTVALFPVYARLIPLTAAGLPRQIANCHLAIKLVNALLVLPFAGLFVRFVSRLVPGEDKLDAAPFHLDYAGMHRPRPALESAAREIGRICGVCLEMIRDATAAFLARDERAQQLVLKREAMVDDLAKAVGRYVLDVSRRDLDASVRDRPQLLLHVMSDVERIGDHAENIAELSQVYSSRDSRLSEAAVVEVRELALMIDGLGAATLRMLGGEDSSGEVLRRKEEINAAVDGFLDRHAERLRQGTCTAVAAVVYTDVVINLRRVANHLRNIAMSVHGRTPERTLRVRRLAVEDEC